MYSAFDICQITLGSIFAKAECSRIKEIKEEHKKKKTSMKIEVFFNDSRGERIRTFDPLVPNQVR